MTPALQEALIGVGGGLAVASGSWVAEEAGALVCKTLCRHGIISRFSARPPLAQHAPDNFWSIAIPYTGLYWAGENLP